MLRGGQGGGARKWVPRGVFRPFRGDGAGSVCGRTGHPSRGAAGSAAPRQPHFVPPLRGARRKARGARIHLPRVQDARPPRGGRAEGKHQKTERVWSFVKKQAKQNAELKKKIKIKAKNLEQNPRRNPSARNSGRSCRPAPLPGAVPSPRKGKSIYFVCVCVKMCARERRRTHHFAGITRPDRGRIGNAEASPASSATCWLKHQLGQNKKLLKKNLLKITEIEPPPPSLPNPPRTAHVSCYNYDYQ